MTPPTGSSGATEALENPHQPSLTSDDGASKVAVPPLAGQCPSAKTGSSQGGRCRLPEPRNLFDGTKTAVQVAAEFAAVAAANVLVRWLSACLDLPCPRFWPLHIFHPRWPGIQDICVALLLAGIFALGLRWLERTRYSRIAAVAAFGTLLILGTNAAQGLYFGFTRPIAGGTVQYYHDAERFGGEPAAFLRDFNALQPRLGDHGRTHPPGAVLLLEVLRRVTGDRPAVIALLVAVASAFGSALAFRRLVAALLPGASVNAAALLLLLLPAVQIYYCASLDAVIAALLLGAVALYAGASRPGPLAGATACLAAASFLTFGFVWALPPLLAAEAVRPINVRSGTWLRPAILLGALAAFYAALWQTTGFDYAAALRTAARLENPNGFRLLSDPPGYLLTRLEAIGEIAVFAGPVLLALLPSGLRALRRASPSGYRLCLAALGSLLFLFLAGAYRTGETARACLFVWPFLLLPAVAMLGSRPRERQVLLYFVFGQALLMQLFGRYFW